MILDYLDDMPTKSETPGPRATFLKRTLNDTELALNELIASIYLIHALLDGSQESSVQKFGCVKE
jgi:hypothetical protein